MCLSVNRIKSQHKPHLNTSEYAIRNTQLGPHHSRYIKTENLNEYCDKYLGHLGIQRDFSSKTTVPKKVGGCVTLEVASSPAQAPVTLARTPHTLHGRYAPKLGG